MLLNSRLRLTLSTPFPVAPRLAKVPTLLSDPLPSLSAGDVSVCDIFSSAGGFAYAQLLPPAVERDGQIAERGSNLVTLSSPLFSPLFFPCPCLPGCHCRAVLEAAGCLWDVPESQRTQRRAGAFFPEGVLAKKKTNPKPQSAHGASGTWRRWRWRDGSGATATGVDLAGCSGDDWTGIADPRGSW